MKTRSILRVGAFVGILLTFSACGGHAASIGNSQPNAITVPTPTPEIGEHGEVISHTVTATTYWIGEGATEENDYISNVPSAWDANSVATFGGVDSSENDDFIPLHNSYYFALPAAEFTEDGLITGARERSPWAEEMTTLHGNESLFKGRWVKITNADKIIFAQWQDVGPNEEQDYDYVFGGTDPKNAFGEHAGIDLSPEASNALNIQGSAEVTWEFIDEGDVPDGPWRTYPPIDNVVRW